MQILFWKMPREDGSQATRFKKLAQLGTNYFEGTHEAENKVSNVEVIKMIYYFSKLLEDKDNKMLLEEVPKDEFREVMYTFKKTKDPIQMDGQEDDILNVINESGEFTRILASFDTTFLTFIPNFDNPKSFEEFRPKYFLTMFIILQV